MENISDWIEVDGHAFGMKKDKMKRARGRVSGSGRGQDKENMKYI